MKIRATKICQQNPQFRYPESPHKIQRCIKEKGPVMQPDLCMRICLLIT
jgi:hypothetical protein